MNTANTKNAKVLRFLEKENEGFPLFLLPEDLPVDPYAELGCHPDIVERLWNELNPKLPSDCRSIIYGTPALTRKDTGLILAIAIGTEYAIRLPENLLDSAIIAGVSTSTKWSDGGNLDATLELGENWVFGAWLDLEVDGINQSYLI